MEFRTGRPPLLVRHLSAVTATQTKHQGTRAAHRFDSADPLFPWQHLQFTFDVEGDRFRRHPADWPRQMDIDFPESRRHVLSGQPILAEQQEIS